jgi:hypothetical protein
VGLAATAGYHGCKLIQYDPPPVVVVRVSRVACREVLGVAPPNDLVGSLVSNLEAKDKRGFPRRFTVTAVYRTAAEEQAETPEVQPEGHTVHWGCRTTPARTVLLTGGHFKQVRKRIACGHARQRAEMQFQYRPFAA